MDDLISRQAAIDAINKIAPVDTEYNCTLLDRVDVRYVLDELPSVEPKLIKCDYVKACNKVTMNKTFSALRYLAMLDDFEEYGYVLVDTRKGRQHESN